MRMKEGTLMAGQSSNSISSQKNDRAARIYYWQTAVGLQDIDQLRPSEYLLKTAKENIEGGISIGEAGLRIEGYYMYSADASRETQEADRVCARMAEILSEDAFVFSPAQYLSIHRRLFTGIDPDAGKLREADIARREWVLNGAEIVYKGAGVKEAIINVLEEEREFKYISVPAEDAIDHLAHFITSLWQIYAFDKGNTRTAAVFFIKYIRHLGFNAENSVFAGNAWYFKNALVRAVYSDPRNGIYEDRSFLNAFLENLILGTNNELSSRRLHIARTGPEVTQTPQPEPYKTGAPETAAEETPKEKETLEEKKVPQKKVRKQHIKQPVKHWRITADMEDVLRKNPVSSRTKKNIIRLYEEFGGEVIFGRGDVIKVLGITGRPATTLISRMHELGLTESISGAGKGRYRFR